MIDHAALQRAFAEYADALLRRYDIGDVLYRLTDHVVTVLGVDGAGVSLGMTAEELRFISATDRRVDSIEAVQIETAEGPCVEAYHSGSVVAVPDLHDDSRWPEYRRVADEVGFRAVAGIPMPVGERRIGALNLYSSEPRDWTEDGQLDVAQLLANIASGYILNWQDLDKQTTLAKQLETALGTRVVIEQAKGVLAGRHGIGVSEAFELLRKHSRQTRTRIHDVAQRVVDGELPL